MGLIDRIGGLSDALFELHSMMRAQKLLKLETEGELPPLPEEGEKPAKTASPKQKKDTKSSQKNGAKKKDQKSEKKVRLQTQPTEQLSAKAPEHLWG